MVPLADRRQVDAVALDRRALARCLEAAGSPEMPVYVFTIDRTASPSSGMSTYSRMLAPGFGITEDPATGSACGPLGSYLVHHRAIAEEHAGRIVNRQGVMMGRPSVIHIAIEGRPDGITRVRVGGEAVLVGQGQISEF